MQTYGKRFDRYHVVDVILSLSPRINFWDSLCFPFGYGDGLDVDPAELNIFSFRVTPLQKFQELVYLVQRSNLSL